MRSSAKRRGGVPLIALGLALMLAGGAALISVPDLLEYALPAPQGEGALESVYNEGMEQLAGMSDTLDAYALCARLQGAGISANGRSGESTTLYAVGAGYFDVRHERLIEGRFISETDVARADSVMVISDEAAITLFPGVDPLGQKALLSGREYEVVGVFRGGRRIGEADAQLAYIPITTAGKSDLAPQTLELVARGAPGVGTAILMDNTLGAWKSGGSFYSLAKLKLGAVMPLRWLVLIVGALLLLALLRRLNALVWARVCHFAQALRLEYAVRLFPSMLANGLLALSGYAALAAATFLLARFSIEPLLVFTEWVPEVIVELSSLASRFWSLGAQNAACVRCVTREVCQAELGQGLVRWGLTAALLGEALRGLPWLSDRPRLARLNRDR